MAWSVVGDRLRTLLSHDAGQSGSGDHIRIVIHEGTTARLARERHTDGRARATRIQAWRRRALLRMGARIHLTMLQRVDDCSMAILDPQGLVMCWYGRSGDRERTSAPVVDRHVAQFYTALDVVTYLPQRHLRVAETEGSSSQEGWRVSAAGHMFWGVTDIRVMSRRDGAVQGFVHVIRPSRGPWESVPVAFGRPIPALGRGFLLHQQLAATVSPELACT